MSSKNLLAMTAMAMIISACGSGEQTELREWMREQAKSMPGGVPPLPEIKLLPAVNYEGKGLVVPFSPQKVVTVDASASTASAQRENDRMRQPLESFPLEDLTVRGVILAGKRPYALIQPKPPNKPMHVGVGDYMGQNYGKVVSINSDAVTVLETIRDNNGVWTEREIIKTVPRQGGAK